MDSDEDLQPEEMWSNLIVEQNPELDLLADLVRNISTTFEAQHGPIERPVLLAAAATTSEPAATTFAIAGPSGDPSLAIEGYQPLTRGSENSLPDELIEMIFLYLKINNFVPAMRVCQAWKEVISSKRFMSLWLSNQPVPEKVWKKYFPMQTLVAMSPIVVFGEKEFEGVPKREVQSAEATLLAFSLREKTEISTKQNLTSDSVFETMKENICTYLHYVLPETKLLNICVKYNLVEDNEALLYIVAYLQMPPLIGEQIAEMFTKVHSGIFTGYDVHHPTMYLTLAEPSAKGFVERAADLLTWFRSLLALYLTPEKILASKDCRAIRQC